MAADKAARRSPSSASHKQQRAVGRPLLPHTRARPLYGNKGRQKWSHVTQEVNSVQNGVLAWYVWHVAATPSAAPNNEARIPKTMPTVCVRRHRIPVCVCSWHGAGHTQDTRQAAPHVYEPKVAAESVQFPSSCVNGRSPIIFQKYGISPKRFMQSTFCITVQSFGACLCMHPGSYRPNVALPPDTTGGGIQQCENPAKKNVHNC